MCCSLGVQVLLEVGNVTLGEMMTIALEGSVHTFRCGFLTSLAMGCPTTRGCCNCSLDVPLIMFGGQ